MEPSIVYFLFYHTIYNLWSSNCYEYYIVFYT